jgi:hypothetical protein
MPRGARILILVVLLGLVAWGIFEVITIVGNAAATGPATSTPGQRIVTTVIETTTTTSPEAEAQPGETIDPKTWQFESPRRCYMDFDTTLPLTDEKRLALVPIDCKPYRTPGAAGTPISLMYNTTSLGRVIWASVLCQTDLPDCCVANPGGMRANEEAAAKMGTTQEEAFAKICMARYDCEHDPVYTSGVAPWIQDAPLDCFSDANVNTCVHLLTERADPGTWRPADSVRSSLAATNALIETLCRDDSRTVPPKIVPGNMLPTMTAAELASACLAAGHDRTQLSTTAPCPAAPEPPPPAAGAVRQRRSLNTTAAAAITYHPSPGSWAVLPATFASSYGV